MKFSGYVDYGTRKNLQHFGDDAFNILNNEWMDIYDILRIRTQVAIT